MKTALWRQPVAPPPQAGPPVIFRINITDSVSGPGATRVARQVTGTALEVAQALAKPIAAPAKDAAPLFSVGVLRDDLAPHESASTKDALSGVQAVVLDFDDITPGQVTQARNALARSGYVFLMYPTFTWTQAAPRWRVVVFLARVAPVEQYPKLWSGLGHLVGRHGDASARKPAQRYYLHSRPASEQAARPDAVVGGTQLIDPDELAALAQPEHTAPANAAPPDRTSVNDEILDNRRRDAGLIASQCGMVRAFFDGEPLAEPVWRAVCGTLKFCLDGERHWHIGSAKDARYDRQEAQRKWDLYKAGPSRCGAAPQCGTCPHRTTISSPIQLGDASFGNTPVAGQANPDALTSLLAGDGLQPVMDKDGQLNFAITTGPAGRRVRTVLPANSEAASDAIIAMTGAKGKPPSDRAIETLKATLRHTARQQGESTSIYLRTAEIDGVVFVDLGPGRIARIGPTGWTVVDDVAEGVPLFRRGQGTGELPDPQTCASVQAALRFALGQFHSEFGLKTPQALAVVVAILEWHRTRSPHPILEAVGPAGSGKSSLADYVVALIDPPGDGGRVTVGTAGPDIAAAAQHRYVLTLDNAGRLDKATCDLLCIVSTGGTLQVRQLYTNGDTAKLKLQRPLLVTAVHPVCVTPDLQSRVLRLELPARQGDYVSEATLRARWHSVRPQMLGALYTLLSSALAALSSLRQDDTWTHRQVDYDQLGEAVVRAAGGKRGTFQAAIAQLRETMARRTASGDLFLLAITKALHTLARNAVPAPPVSLNTVLQTKPSISTRVNDEGKTEIIARPGALRQLLPIASHVQGRDAAIPQTDRGLTDALRRVQPLLASLGIAFTERASGTRSLYQFEFAMEALNDD